MMSPSKNTNAYVCVSWEDRNGLPYAIIDGNLSEEAYG